MTTVNNPSPSATGGMRRISAVAALLVSVVGDRDEEVLLPTGEVVVQRTPRHASLVEDLSDTHLRRRPRLVRDYLPFVPEPLPRP